MGPKRVLVVSTAVGGGHKAAARAVEQAIAERYPDVAVRNIDVLDYASRPVAHTYAWAYHFTAGKAPIVWAMVYGGTDKPLVSGVNQENKPPFYTIFDPWIYRKFFREIDRFKPDQIVCTHFLPADILRYYKNKDRLRAGVSVIVTDFGPMHSFWCSPTADRFFVATEEARHQLTHAGIPPERAIVSGIPIAPVFATEPTTDAIAAAREWLGLKDKRPTITIMIGGWRTGGVGQMAEALLEIDKPLNVVFLVGRDAAVEAQMKARTWPDRLNVTVQGFTDRMHDVMRVTDLMVTKPGGLTTAECLASETAMAVLFPVPGQEDRNSDWLLEHGAAIKAQSLTALSYKLGDLLQDHRHLTKLKEAARAQGRPDAAYRVADAVCDPQAEATPAP